MSPTQTTRIAPVGCLVALMLLLQTDHHACAQGVDSVPPLVIPRETPAQQSPEIRRRPEIRERPDLPLSTPQAGFVISLRSELLRGFVNRQVVTSDDVVTRVMEADVRGVQTTTTNIELCSSRCDSLARLDLVATGTVNSNTVGYTPRARVNTAGHHTFQIRKPVYFDGRHFMTKRAFGSLQARQVPQAVQSIASGVPLIGKLGDQIAWREVYRRMPRSDAITVRRVAEQVLPRVNDGIDAELRKTNRRWADIRRTLARSFPTDELNWSAASTEDSFSVFVRNPSVELPSAQSLHSAMDDVELAAIVLADSAVNRWFRVQPIAGVTIPDTAFQEVVSAVKSADSKFSALVAALKNPALLQSEPRMFSVRLADESPVALAFDYGELELQLRYQIVPKAGVASQVQQMRIRLTGSGETDGKWSLNLTDVTVDPADDSEPVDTWTQLFRDQAALMKQLIPPTVFSRSLDLSKMHEKLPVVELHRIQTDRGWLRISLRQQEIDEQMTRRSP